MTLCTIHTCPNRNCRREMQVFICEENISPPATWFRYTCPHCNVEAVFALGGFHTVPVMPPDAIQARRFNSAG